ncbi:MAG: adenylate cyclase, partial [Mesorhizobium sp.]
MQGSRFAFGPFVLDSGAGTLLRNDVPVAVGYRGLNLLAPAADGGEWIATVPRVGYRFTGAVEQLDGAKRKPLTLPGKPSIAVLPFVNVSNDPEQESFADGLTEDLITDLSRISGLFVIARNSAFAYKRKPMAVREIAEDLGVRYLLE